MENMDQIQNVPMPPHLVISLVHEKVKLPVAVRAKVDKYWQELITKNSKLRNGEVFTVTSVEWRSDSVSVIIAETNYAHYVYSEQIGGLEQYTVRVIHPDALIVSSDNKFIFGSMGAHTSRPGIIQCCGGGIDYSDIEDDVVNIEHCITKELLEELGLDAYDKQRVKEFHHAYLKSGGLRGKITISYILRINQTARQFMIDYEKFVKSVTDSGDEPEFGELFCIDNNQESLEDFIANYHERLNEYMAVLLRDVHRDFQV